MTDLTERAMRAHARHAAREGQVPQQPAAAESGPETIDGRIHVVLRNTRGVIAVYAVTSTGRIRRLDVQAWPKSLQK